MCFLKLQKIHMKTSLLESLFNNIAAFKAWNFIKERLQHRYLPVNFVQFFKKPYLENISRWLLLLIPPLQPKFYPLIKLCLFSSSLISFTIDNCNHRSLLTEDFFTIVYSKININVVKTISLWQWFADTH